MKELPLFSPYDWGIYQNKWSIMAKTKLMYLLTILIFMYKSMIDSNKVICSSWKKS